MSTYDAPPGPGPAFDPASYAHTMVADDATARTIGWAVVRYRLVRPRLLVVLLLALVLVAYAALEVVATGGRDPSAAIGFLAPLILLAIVTVSLAGTLRHARRMAPPGTVLAFDAAPGRVRVRTAIAEATFLHDDIKAVHEKGACTLLVLRAGVVPLPTELVDEDLERLLRELAERRVGGTSVASPPGGTIPPTAHSATPDLPYVLDCVEDTATRLYRDFVLRALRQPGFVVCVGAVALLVVIVATTGSAIAWPVLGSLVAVLLLTALGMVRARGQFHRYYAAGTRVAAGVVGGDLLVQRGDRLSRIALAGIKDVRRQPSGLVLRTTAGGRESLPADLLPPAEVQRLRSAAQWYAARR